MKWICRILVLVLLTPCASLFAQGRYSGLWLSGDMDFGFSFTSSDYARKTEHLLHSNSSIAGGSIALGYATKRGRHSVGLGFQGTVSGSPKSMSFAGIHLDLRTKPIALNDDIFLNLRLGLPISVSYGGGSLQLLNTVLFLFCDRLCKEDLEGDVVWYLERWRYLRLSDFCRTSVCSI